MLEQLLPALRQSYGDLEPTQEDWGWFVWFEHVGVKLAVDVFTQNPITNEFEIRLTSRKARLLRSARVVDTPELEALRRRVVSQSRGLARHVVDRRAAGREAHAHPVGVEVCDTIRGLDVDDNAREPLHPVVDGDSSAPLRSTSARPWRGCSVPSTSTSGSRSATIARR